MFFKKKKKLIDEVTNWLDPGVSLIEEDFSISNDIGLTKEQKDIFSRISSLLQDNFSYKTYQNKKYGDMFNNIMFIKINDDMSLNISFSYNTSPQLVSATTIRLLIQFMITPDEDFLFNMDTELYLFGKENILKILNNPSEVNQLEIN